MYRLAFTLIAIGLLFGGCTKQQADNVVNAASQYDDAVMNFQRATQAVNGSIALTSATMGPYCSALIAADKNIADLASKSPSATVALNSGAAALTSYCAALPQDIQGAITQLTAAAVAAKNAAKGS